MNPLTEEVELKLPLLLDRRWKDIKTAIFNLVKYHSKTDLIQELINLREKHTSAPTLSEITKFTGFDVAIHTISGWNWQIEKEERSISYDVAEIGNYGAELMVVHTLRESIRNMLLVWEDNQLKETEIGKTHFQALNSFNVDITGSRIDIAKKRFSQGRLTKQQRKMDPINRIPSVKRLYWENSILMLLRSPLPFYRAMQLLNHEDQLFLLKLHSKLISKSTKQNHGTIRIRLNRKSNASRILDLLSPSVTNTDRRPKFVACIKIEDNHLKEKVDYILGLGAMTMFTMFFMGFNKEKLDEKARRAEEAVRDIIEHSGYYKVIESNTEVVFDEGEVITEIDLIARAKFDEDLWITCEVKDFSFWRGWIFGQGADLRKKYYSKAIQKLEVKEEFIQKSHSCKKIESIIVTSIPEPYQQLDGTPLVYLSDLNEYLAKMANLKFTPRKRHSSGNFLIRYFDRLSSDYASVDDLMIPYESLAEQIEKIKNTMKTCKAEYDNARATYKMLISEHDTLKLEEKLIRKRLIKDTGERHFQIETVLEKVKAKIKRSQKDKKIRIDILNDLKTKYQNQLQELRGLEKERERILKSRDRYLLPRLF